MSQTHGFGIVDAECVSALVTEEDKISPFEASGTSHYARTLVPFLSISARSLSYFLRFFSSGYLRETGVSQEASGLTALIAVSGKWILCAVWRINKGLVA